MPSGHAAEAGSLLFTHSSRCHFVARLNSSVGRPHLSQVHASIFYVLLMVCSTIVISQEQYVFQNCSDDAENP